MRLFIRMITLLSLLIAVTAITQAYRVEKDPMENLPVGKEVVMEYESKRDLSESFDNDLFWGSNVYKILHSGKPFSDRFKRLSSIFKGKCSNVIYTSNVYYPNISNFR